MIKQECDSVKHVLFKLNELEGIDILSPFGTALVNVPLADDDIDESLEAPTIVLANRTMELDSHESEMRINVEDELAANLASSNLASSNIASSNTEITKAFDSKVLIKGTAKNKARALKDFSKFRKHAGSTDRLKHVQSVLRYIDHENLFNAASPLANNTLEPHIDDSQKIVMSDPIVTLIRIENDFWLCIGEINGLRIDGQPVDCISFEMLTEETVKVSYQMLGLRPATLADDPEGRNDWRTYMTDERSFTVPERLVQSLNPTTSKSVPLSMPFYLLQSTVLVAITASIFQSLTISDLKSVPKLVASKEYPYREASG